MKRINVTRLVMLGLSLWAGAAAALGQSGSAAIGLFEGHGDVGTLLQPGSAEYEAATKTYTVGGSGENMWAKEDDFHFIWRKVTAKNSKNLSLAADISILGSGGDNHRKAMLIVRQNLNADSAYADAALHGNGLTSLQFRETQGEATHEIESSISAPKGLKLEKRGDRFYLWTHGGGRQWQFAGGSTKVELEPPFYVGIGVCAHNKNAFQKAAFTNVDLHMGKLAAEGRYSTLQSIAVASTDALVSYMGQEPLQTAGWNLNGTSLLFYTAGKLQSVPLKGGTPQVVTDGSVMKPEPADAAKGPYSRLSPDGRQVAFLTFFKEKGGKGNKQDVVLSVMSVADKKTRVLAKLVGGPGTLSANPWSPDGKRITYVSYQDLK
jgi:TolB protein